MSSTATTGTVKIGRWTYPVRTTADGTERNASTKGTGEWVALEEPKFDDVVWDAPAAKPAKSELSPYDTAMLAAIGATQNPRLPEGFDFFDDGIVAGSGIWFEHAAQQTENPQLARRAFKSLANKGYLEIGNVDSDAKDRWMCLTEKGAEAAIAHRGQSTELPEGKSGHTTGGGNQTKKPGRSTWKVGTPCPQGHKLTAESLYTMPSGRHQCRECRNTMPSRVSKSSK